MQEQAPEHGSGSASGSLFALYTIHVDVGGQELESKRRYSEFRALDQHLRVKHAVLLSAVDPLPAFPPKRVLRSGHHPAVVQERVRALDAWLRSVTNLFQFTDVRLVVFLCLPFYLAVRVLTGDAQADDAEFTESRSPSRSPEGVIELDLDLSSARPRSPDTARLDEVAERLPQSVGRPGYREASHFLAKAACWHVRATLGVDVPLAEALRFVHGVCGRAFFKPSSIICSVVYLDRLPRSMVRSLFCADGWKVTLLTLLVISAKQWDSDYPISTADVCSQSGTRGADPTFDARRVNESERRVLKMLDYCTVITQAEFARYYLTIPFAFCAAESAADEAGPDAAGWRAAGWTRKERLVSPSMSCSAIRSGRAEPARRSPERPPRSETPP